MSSRTQALRILERVDEGELLHQVFADEMSNSALSERDRHLSQELSFGVTRHRLRYDAFIAELAKSSAPTGTLRNVIRLGLHQLFAMRLADHAAVNETVELSRHAGLGAKAGFVNGLLRNAQRLGEHQLLEMVLTGLRPYERLGLQYSHPNWVVNEYAEQLERCGLGADLETALAHNNSLPHSYLACANDSAIVATSSRAATVTTALKSCLCLAESLNPAILSDEVWVQDLASQAVTRAFYNAIPSGSKWVVDACAAPGGKSRLLRSVLAADVKLLSIDKSANRLKPLYSVKRDENWKVLTTDFTAMSDNHFDAILIDAPCSSLGSVRRKPDTKYRNERVDLSQYFDQQTALLNAAWGNLRPGGIAGYVTCTPTVIETDRVIRETQKLGWHFLDAGEGLRELSSEFYVSSRPNGAALLWGHRNSSDTMFLALLRKPEGA